MLISWLLVSGWVVARLVSLLVGRLVTKLVGSMAGKLVGGW